MKHPLFNNPKCHLNQSVNNSRDMKKLKCFSNHKLIWTANKLSNFSIKSAKKTRICAKSLPLQRQMFETPRIGSNNFFCIFKVLELKKLEKKFLNRSWLLTISRLKLLLKRSNPRWIQSGSNRQSVKSQNGQFAAKKIF